jgi:hypothetical protein
LTEQKPEINNGLRDPEKVAMNLALTDAREQWRHDAYLFKNFVPDLSRVGNMAGMGIAVTRRNTDQVRGDAELFDAVWKELAERLGVKP